MANGDRRSSLCKQGNESLAMPHLSVPDISVVDWDAIRAAGFEGCVFDKDNTLTLPYAEHVAPTLMASLAQCQRAFAGKVVLFSNSAGLKQFDPDGGASRPSKHCPPQKMPHDGHSADGWPKWPKRALNCLLFSCCLGLRASLALRHSRFNMGWNLTKVIVETKAAGLLSHEECM
jgi:Mitochondrial PGP phosphatase